MTHWRNRAGCSMSEFFSGRLNGRDTRASDAGRMQESNQSDFDIYSSLACSICYEIRRLVDCSLPSPTHSNQHK